MGYCHDKSMSRDSQHSPDTAGFSQTHLRLKSHLQSECMEIRPPRRGPRTNAMASVAPIIAPIRLGRWAGPTSTRAIWVKLYRPDAPMPWKARHAMLMKMCHYCPTSCFAMNGSGAIRTVQSCVSRWRSPRKTRRRRPRRGPEYSFVHICRSSWRCKRQTL